MLPRSVWVAGVSRVGRWNASFPLPMVTLACPVCFLVVTLSESEWGTESELASAVCCPVPCGSSEVLASAVGSSPVLLPILIRIISGVLPLRDSVRA